MAVAGPEATMTAQGHPHAIFKRAVEHGNLLVAETILRSEIPRPTRPGRGALAAALARSTRRRDDL
jgi:hypothetical protein